MTDRRDPGAFDDFADLGDPTDFEGLDEVAQAGGAVDVELLLHRAVDVIANARPMPLSSSVMINRDEVVGLVSEALERLPGELRAARHLLREREEQLAKTRREGDEILDAARLQAERMVERTEVVREARKVARQVMEEAEERARRLRHEAEDFCDQKLAQFEIVLDRTMRTVQAGRNRLTTVSLVDEESALEREASVEADFFDQDQR